ncbi:cAMP-binding protein OS=Streptomyces tendae OX=1932 GN=GUR47_11425 PE=4 SV=1 [Streptomyces tendae]
MEIDRVLAIRVETENWQTRTRIRAAELRELVTRIGSAGDRFLVLQRIPDVPDVFAQVWHEEGGAYRLEHRAAVDAFFGTDLDDPHRVAGLLTGWARQESGWDAGVAWEPVPVPPQEEVPALPDEVRAQVERRVREQLRCGYDDRGTLSEIAEEHLVGGAYGERPVSRAQARQLVDRLWLERLAEQDAWGEETTDPDRLARVFRALDAAGVTARENFACCRGCGTAEIGAEREGARGFVFFHRQSTEAAAEGHGLMLYYGGFDGSEETTTAVGHEVVAAFAGSGLSTEWDGDPGSAISVTLLDWRKRLEG